MPNTSRIWKTHSADWARFMQTSVIKDVAHYCVDMYSTKGRSLHNTAQWITRVLWLRNLTWDHTKADIIIEKKFWKINIFWCTLEIILGIGDEPFATLCAEFGRPGNWTLGSLIRDKRVNNSAIKMMCIVKKEEFTAKATKLTAK